MTTSGTRCGWPGAGAASSSPSTTSPSKDSCQARTPAWSSTTSRPASSPSAASWPWSRPTSWAT
ncbi:hypothetical protein DV515_00017269 [Chloebia gouldiae]|uniref:Uncharacterized protein n=1 Tax=Chloebia gouldiae TaxID=44316 RepID=A0A3L8R0Q0_CHLGU|nr:hypothetical protein DV515_00017269 [Chloebia gouldiae]